MQVEKDIIESLSDPKTLLSASRRKSRTWKRSSRRKWSESDTSDEYSSDSEEEYRRKTRKRSRRRRARKLSESDQSEDSDSEEEYRRKKKKRSRRKSSRRGRKGIVSRKRRRDASSSEDSDVSRYSEDKLKRQKIVLSKNKKEREPEGESGRLEKVDNKVELKTGELKKNKSSSELFVFKDNKGTLVVESMVVGPMPLPKPEGRISYGGALRPGEGDATAQYVQQGKRIPRRGEVGLSADENSRFESVGYVMSGNRHSRMNGVGIRKENQVYSAEDNRALAMFNYEEKAKRKQKIMAHMQHMVQLHTGKDEGPSHDPFADGRPAEDAHD